MYCFAMASRAGTANLVASDPSLSPRDSGYQKPDSSGRYVPDRDSREDPLSLSGFL